ncbi:MAG: transglutaminase-like domain-containing protein [Alphaproteobacteria bacterium]|nr:transglutaminase-like domain-containing protein [Alphaproteobacteria bacterium]
MIPAIQQPEAPEDVSGPEEIRKQLAQIGERDDAAIDPAEAALLLAGLDHPDVDVFGYRRHLAGLAADVAALGHRGNTLEGRTWAVARVLFERHGYQGDRSSYDNMDNADLISVIDRKMGIPVSLGILYIHVARSMNWVVEGLNFPSHFLLRLDGEGERAIVDPFDDGAILEPPALRDLAKQVLGTNTEMDRAWFEPVGNRSVLLRLQNNIRTRALQNGELDRGAEVTRRMILIAPGSKGLQRDLGMVEAHRGNVGAAIEAFHLFLETAPVGAERAEAEQMLSKLRLALN